MSRARRLLVAVVSIALLGGVAGFAPAQSAPVGQQAVGYATARVDWHPCKHGPLQCARMPVPLDYDNPGGSTIGIELIRARATGDRAAKGTIFVNPGGPGGSGVGFVRFLGRSLFTAEVRRRFHIVGFDPRGIAGSAPIECFDRFQDALEVLPPFAFPYTDSQERRWIRSNREYADACAEAAGPIIDHMSTANVARDIDLLRKAVGERRTTFVGYSYGSMIGSTYAAMFPDRVRAVVIDGVIDPISWSTGRGDEAETLPVDARLRSEEGAYATLQQFLTLCDNSGDRCAFSAGDPRRRFHRLAMRLRDDPVHAFGERFGYTDLVAVSLGSMYDASSWRDFARLLEELSDKARPDQIEQLLRRVRPGPGEPVGPVPWPTRGSSQVLEGFAGVTCSDTDNPDSFQAWEDAAAAADRRAPYFGRIWVWGSSICAVWPGVDEDRFTGPYSAETANPVLVVGNRFDPATRYQDAASTAGILGNARLLTLEGWGHTSLFLSRCIDAYTADYLLHRRLPPRGASCRPDRTPFGG